ncbi:MAG: class I SAM-dependent methyltransferase [Rhodospirillales bacterium]|nr:class I SAM-dependent methyltransferase [Rhodospirillales bacterium]
MVAFDSRLLDDLERIGGHYTDLVGKHGDGPQSAQWRDRESQERRMRVLAEVGDLSGAKVLDFGCGTGHLLDFLREFCAFPGEYVGYDICADAIRLASEKYPAIRFERRNILVDAIEEDFDYVLISGVFNHRTVDSWGLLRTVLSLLFAHTRKALAFNLLSTYVDYCDPELAYVRPEAVFAFCKETLSPLVTLRHDYCIKPGVVPFEFTVYVHQTDIPVRKSLLRLGQV